jgi:hypothetical protein
MGGRKQSGRLREVLLEPGGGDDLQSPRRLFSRVPEGVRDAPQLEDEISRTGYADLVPDLDADLTLEHVGVLVLVGVVCIGAARARGSIGCSTRAKVPPLRAPSIMNLTPSPPNCTLSPSFGDSTMRPLPAPVMVVLLYFGTPRLVGFDQHW